MISYGGLDVQELSFGQFRADIETVNGQWLHVNIRFDLAEASRLPDDVTALSALLIATPEGVVVEVVPQDEGRDCEYRFTEEEQRQLRAFFAEEVYPAWRRSEASSDR